MRADDQYPSSHERQHWRKLWQSLAGIDVCQYLMTPTEVRKLSLQTTVKNTPLAWNNTTNVLQLILAVLSQGTSMGNDAWKLHESTALLIFLYWEEYCSDSKVKGLYDVVSCGLTGFHEISVGDLCSINYKLICQKHHPEHWEDFCKNTGRPSLILSVNWGFNYCFLWKPALVLHSNWKSKTEYFQGAL